jgi:uridine kinase
MIGDKILINEIHHKKANLIYSKLQGKVIGIGGLSGVGKTEIALCLQELLYKDNYYSLLISLDDYYRTNFNDRNRIRKKKGLRSVGVQEIDWELVERAIKQFKEKKEIINLQQINKFTNSFFEVYVYGANKLHYLIIEGLYAGYLKKMKLLDYYVHLKGNLKQTKKFRLERMKENERDNFRKKVVQKEANVIAQLKKFADLIIPFKGG